MRHSQLVKYGNTSILNLTVHPFTPAARAEAINAGTAATIVVGDDMSVGMEALVLM